MRMIDLIGLIERHQAWSKANFGEEDRTEGILEHIQEEIEEVRKDPQDLFEWVDILILATDGATTNGYTPQEIAMAWEQKQGVNERRKWSKPAPGQPTRHIKEE